MGGFTSIENFEHDRCVDLFSGRMEVSGSRNSGAIPKTAASGRQFSTTLGLRMRRRMLHLKRQCAPWRDWRKQSAEGPP